MLYDHMLNGQASRQHQQELIREAQAIRLAKTASKRNQPASPHIITPIRRAAYLIASLVR